MNNVRRNILKQAVSALETAESYLSTALDQEQDCLDSVPENLENSERYEKMEDAVGLLEEASDYISDVKSKIENAMI